MILAATAVFALFGVASIAGGALGFKKAGSKASLIAGGISGLLLLIAAGLVVSGSVSTGLGLGIVTSLLLAGRFVPAYLKTKKPMPQGMMAVLSVISALVAAAAFATV
jgi:uncharacterized membrane protein (UPF0136 family)